MTGISSDVIKQLRVVIREELAGALDQNVTSPLDNLQRNLHALTSDMQTVKQTLGVHDQKFDHLSSDMQTVMQTLSTHGQNIHYLTDDMQTIKYTLGSHGLMLGGLRADVSATKQALRGQSKDVHQLAVLFEDLDDRFEAVAESR